MADPVSIGEDLVKLIKELKNRSDQVRIMETLPSFPNMTNPIPIAQGESERALLDNKRHYQLYPCPAKLKARLQP